MSKHDTKRFINIRINMSQDDFDSFLASVPGARTASGATGIYVAMMIAEGMLRVDRIGVAELMRSASKERTAHQILKKVRISSEFTYLISLYETLPSGLKAETIGSLIKKAISIYMDENSRDASMLIDLATQRMEEIVMSAVPVTETSDMSLPMPEGRMGKENLTEVEVKNEEGVSVNDAAQNMNEVSSIFMNDAKAAKMAAKIDPNELQDLADLEAMLQFDDMTPSS